MVVGEKIIIKKERRREGGRNEKMNEQMKELRKKQGGKKAGTQYNNVMEPHITLVYWAS